MDPVYDIFEKLPDGDIIWRESVSGHENAVSKLKEFAALRPNQFDLMHLETNSVIARVNTRPDEGTML